MRLVKPNWVTHDGSPIFSIDIHPDGKRFATGGQGGDSGRIVIWSMEPVLSEFAEANPDVPKMLCQLDHHLACVNCVRWSSVGLLASGGDDKLIMIWRLASGIGGSSVFGGKCGIETWRCIATLRSHEGDILDLAWAPHTSWLASASIDNTVIIWETTKSTIVSILKGHTGLVKGVTWDPIGKYLATQSDDKTLRVWRTTDWREESLISEPFEECGGTTHVLRLSWSPDGQYLVSAHAMNGGGPTAQIIERDGWKQDKDFVGHRKAVTCVKFNGNILQKKTNGVNKPLQFCCVAIGSRDRSLSVWSTSLKRPLVVIHELFMSSVLDISWSPCGMRLCACSKDGTIVFIEFTEQELGQPLDSAQQIGIQERLYGKLTQCGSIVVEAPELLLVKPTSQEFSVTGNSLNCNQTSNTPSLNRVKSPIHKQIETRTSDGKRRITPMFIPPSTEIKNSYINEEINPVSITPTCNSSQNKSLIIVEKRDEIVAPNINAYINSDITSNVYAFKKKEQDNQKKSYLSSNKRGKIISEKNSNDILIPPLMVCASLSQQTEHYTATISNTENINQLQVFHATSIEPLWEQYLGYNVTALTMSSSIIAVSLEDGSIHTFYTTKGIRAMPPLAPPSPIAKLLVSESMLMVISCYADVRVWEININSCQLAVSTSAAHLISPGTLLLSSTLYNGMPHLTFTNAKAYIYHKEIGSWLVLGDSQDPVWRWSAVNSSNNTYINGRIPKGPLAVLQEGLNRTDGICSSHLRMPHGISCIISYLELQVLNSKILGSSQEYVHWLMAYVSFLCTHDSSENRLRMILDDLMGPIHSSSNKSSWDPMILGFKRHKLLEEILGILASQMQWQRLYLEYNEQLKDVK